MREINIAKGIQKLPVKTKFGKKYRARKMVNGVRLELRTNNLQKAKQWLRDS